MKIFWKKFNQTQCLFLWWKINGKTAKTAKIFLGGFALHTPTYCSRNIFKNLKTLSITICNIHLKWNLYVWSTFDNNPTVQSKLFSKKSLEPHKARGGGQVRLEKTVSRYYLPKDSFLKFFFKNKLSSFFELPAWWKTSQTSLLTKIRDFDRTETSKTWNLKKSFLEQNSDAPSGARLAARFYDIEIFVQYVTLSLKLKLMKLFLKTLCNAYMTLWASLSFETRQRQLAFECIHAFSWASS